MNTAEQNGLIERANRSIIEIVKFILYYSNIPIEFRHYAVDYAVYLYNITPHSGIEFKSPFELVNNTKPKYNKLRGWGSLTNY